MPPLVAWTADGKRLAGVGSNNVCVWDARTGDEVFSRKEAQKLGMEVNAAWSPDGRWLAITSGGGIKVLEMPGGLELLALADTSRFAWSHDGKRLAIMQSRAVKVFDVQTNREAFALEGTRVAGPGQPVATPYPQSPMLAQSVAWSPDDRFLAAAYQIWDTGSRKVIRLVSGDVDCIFWDAAGPRFASVQANPAKKTWVFQCGESRLAIENASEWLDISRMPPRTPTAFRATWNGVVFSGDGKRMALGGNGFEIWDVIAGKRLRTVAGQEGLWRGFAWDPAEARVAAAGDNGALRIWDVATGRTLLDVPGTGKSTPVSNNPMPLVWSPDGKNLALPGPGHTVRVLDTKTGKMVLALRGHSEDVTALAWSPDGKRLASGSDDATGKVWEIMSGKELVTLRGHRRTLHSLAWSPDGRRLASVGRDDAEDVLPGTLKLWDVATGLELATWPRHVGPVKWSQDGRWLASLSRGALVVLEGKPAAD